MVVYVQSTKESTKISQNYKECSARLCDSASTQINQLGLCDTIYSPSTKKMKYLSIYLTKYTKDLFAENWWKKSKMT